VVDGAALEKRFPSNRDVGSNPTLSANLFMTEPLSAQDAFYELAYYTLAHGDRQFIHQNIVDAFAAQAADINTKPIKITFALIGLYLAVEKGFTGRQVQLAHMQMGKTKKAWPPFTLPAQRGAVTVFDVLKTPPCKERDAMIHKWCESVWKAYAASRDVVVALAQRELGVQP
jgi:hypothetical protein